MSGGYGALITGPAQFAGLDQGIDFTGRGAVHALGAGKITRLQLSGSGWPGEGAILAYQITEKGNPLEGRFMYIAEDFAPIHGLNVGSQIKKGQILGLATGSGLAPGIETGLASDPEGHAYGNPSEGHSGPPDPQAQALDTYVNAASSGSGNSGFLSGLLKDVTNPNPLENPLTNPVGSVVGSVVGGGVSAVEKAIGFSPEDLAKGILSSFVGWIKPEAMKILLYAVFVFGAIALMGYGVATMISPRPPSLRKAAGNAAKAGMVAAAA